MSASGQRLSGGNPVAASRPKASAAVRGHEAIADQTRESRSSTALASVSGALQLREVFVGAFSVVVVRPMSSDAREHSHVGCAAYACEKTTPWAAK